MLGAKDGATKESFEKGTPFWIAFCALRFLSEPLASNSLCPFEIPGGYFAGEITLTMKKAEGIAYEDPRTRQAMPSLQSR